MEEITAVEKPLISSTSTNPFFAPFLVTLFHNQIEKIMKPEQLQQLLNSTATLIEANSKLVDNNSEVIKLVKESINKNDDLMKVAIQIYQALDDKKEKTVRELSWHNALQQIFSPKA